MKNSKVFLLYIPSVLGKEMAYIKKGVYNDSLVSPKDATIFSSFLEAFKAKRTSCFKRQIKIIALVRED